MEEKPKLQEGGIINKPSLAYLPEPPETIIMKEGKGYSSTGVPKNGGIFNHPSLASPQFREWKHSPEIKNLKYFNKKLAKKILKQEIL